MITGIVVASILATLASLIAFRWRINLQRHKFDRATELIDTAYLWGGTEGLREMRPTVDILLTRTTPEPRYTRGWLVRGRRRPEVEAPGRSEDSPRSDAG